MQAIKIHDDDKVAVALCDLKKGQSVEVAPGDGYFVNIKAPNLEGVSLENSYVLRVDPA